MSDTRARSETVLLPWFVGWFLGFALLEAFERPQRGNSAPRPNLDVLSDAFAVNEVRPLDRAAPRELRHLPGIGPTRALAIVRSRWEIGPFRSIADLARVPGIGPGTIESLERWRQPSRYGPRSGRVVGDDAGPYTPVSLRRKMSSDYAPVEGQAALQLTSEPVVPTPASSSPAQARAGNTQALEPIPHPNDPPRRP